MISQGLLLRLTFCFKGKYIHNQKYGVAVKWIELDDNNNDRGCGPFIGFLNIVAGFNDDPQLPCSKFDIASRIYGP